MPQTMPSPSQLWKGTNLCDDEDSALSLHAPTFGYFQFFPLILFDHGLEGLQTIGSGQTGSGCEFQTTSGVYLSIRRQVSTYLIL